MFLVRRGAGAAAKPPNPPNPPAVVGAGAAEAKPLNGLPNGFDPKGPLS
jgi:hypothetical protein